MRILFTKHNVTTDAYFPYLANDNDVFVYSSVNSLTDIGSYTKKIKIRYQPAIVGKLFVKFNISCMYPQYIPKFSATVKKIRPTTIVTNDFYDFIFAQVVSYKKKNPSTKLYVWSETRNWPKFWFTRWIMKMFWLYFKRNLSQVEKVFVFTQEGKEFYTANAPEAEVEVLPAPINSEWFYKNADKEYMPEGVLRIIMNARYIPLKEHKTFFKALALLQQKNIPFAVSLIGRGGHLQSELERYAKQLGIAAYIAWLEPVSSAKMQVVNSAHDVLVLASNREAFGMVVPEGMACGLATVTSQAVGSNVYVKDGETGFIFETGNAADLASKLEKLANKNKVESFGLRAEEQIRQYYTAEKLGEKLFKILREL